MAVRDRAPEPVSYDPLIYTRQSSAWRFALHKSGREWIISDPVSGLKIAPVSAFYKGCPVASGDLSLKNARLAALADLDQLIDRIGFERFSQAIEKAKPKK